MIRLGSLSTGAYVCGAQANQHYPASAAPGPIGLVFNATVLQAPVSGNGTVFLDGPQGSGQAGRVPATEDHLTIALVYKSVKSIALPKGIQEAESEE